MARLPGMASALSREMCSRTSSYPAAGKLSRGRLGVPAAGGMMRPAGGEGLSWSSNALGVLTPPQGPPAISAVSDLALSGPVQVACRLRGSQAGAQTGGSAAATSPTIPSPLGNCIAPGAMGSSRSAAAAAAGAASGSASGQSASPGAARAGTRKRGGKRGPQPSTPSPDASITASPAATAASATMAAPTMDFGFGMDAPPQEPQEQDRDELDVYRGLVLDCSYRPINVVCWKRALCLEFADKVDVLEYYDAVVKSTNQSFPIPAVLRVSNFVHTPKQSKRKLSLSRNNIFLRDKFRCQYCGTKENLTIDHVKALSRGGGSSWENLVTACSPCNLKKGDKSPQEAGMKLMSKPKEPKELDCRNLPPNYKTFRSLARHRHTPPQWLDWLPLQPPQPFNF